MEQIYKYRKYLLHSIFWEIKGKKKKLWEQTIFKKIDLVFFRCLTLINSNSIRGTQFFYNFVSIDKSFLLSIYGNEHFLFVNDLVPAVSLLFQSFCPSCFAKTIVHYNSPLICIILSTIPLTFPRLIRSITLKGFYQCKDSHHDIVPAILDALFTISISNYFHDAWYF